MNKKVLLIYPGVLFSKNWQFCAKFRPQLLILSSFLRENKFHNVDVLDLSLEISSAESPQEVLEYEYKARDLLQKYDYDIIGISCYASVNYLATLVVARVCKELNPACHVIVGGYHPTALPSDFAMQENGKNIFDFIVRGEGEQALLDICAGRVTLQPGCPQIVEGRPRDLSQGMYLDWEGYKYLDICRGNIIGMIFARGCPFKCHYCIASTLTFKAQNYPIAMAKRDVKRAIAMTRPKIFHVFDPLFRFDTPWGRQLANFFIEECPESIYFRFYTRADLLEKTEVDLMARLKSYTYLGLESGSEEMLSIMNKTKNPKLYLEKARNSLREINERKLTVDFGLIYNHPGETEEMADETMGFLEDTFKGQEEFALNFCTNNFAFLPGTFVAENLSYFEKEFGTIVRHKTWWKEPGDQSLLFEDVQARGDTSVRVDWQSKLDHFEKSKKLAIDSFFYRFLYAEIYGGLNHEKVEAPAEVL